MQNTTNAGRQADYAPQVVLQAVLATNLTSFTEFAFGVVRPDIVFKPNWHFEAVTHKLSEVASGDLRRLIITPSRHDGFNMGPLAQTLPTALTYQRWQHTFLFR